MNQTIALPDSMKSQEILDIFDALAPAEVRFVGGCVRDAILGIPTKDIDLCTTLLPEEVMEHLTEKNIKVVPIGVEFGSVMAVHNSTSFEITTLRKDIACDGRHAEVSFSTDFKEDAARRDLTVNAMSCDLSGNLYDYFNGQQDLAEKHIRFVGNAEERVQEDVLRILRFFRFYAQIGAKTMDEEGLTACINHAKLLCNLSGERIQQEMLQLLALPHPIRTLEVMRDENILPHILLGKPDLSGLKKLLALPHEIDPIVHLAAIMRELASKEMHVKALAERWRLSKEQRTQLVQLSLPPFTIEANTNIDTQKKTIRKVGNQRFIEMVLLQWAHDFKNNYQPMIDLATDWEIPLFPVQGKDLIAMGFEPGVDMGELLAKAEEWWEESQYKPGKEEILDWVENRE